MIQPAKFGVSRTEVPQPRLAATDDAARSVARAAIERRISRIGLKTFVQERTAIARYARTKLPDERNAPVTAAMTVRGALRAAALAGIEARVGPDLSETMMSRLYREGNNSLPGWLFDAVVPDEVLAAVAVMVADGPRRSTQRRDAQVLDRFSDLAFTPGHGRTGQHGRARSTLNSERGAIYKLQEVLV
jgi:hypothetical protein